MPSHSYRLWKNKPKTHPILNVTLKTPKIQTTIYPFFFVSRPNFIKFKRYLNKQTSASQLQKGCETGRKNHIEMLRERRVCTMGTTVLPPAAQHKSPIDLTPLPQFHFQEVPKKTPSFLYKIQQVKRLRSVLHR